MLGDFYLRLTALFLLMASFAIFIACAAILPAYFTSSEKYSIVSRKLDLEKSKPLSSFGAQSISEAQDLNSKLTLVENSEKNKFPISEKVIGAVLLDKTPGIKISQILYEDDGMQGRKINILGIASTREALLFFEQTLQNDTAFKNVNLPVSNFVKESNIEFNLSLSSA